MPLAPATRLGPYEVIAAIGAGGMGEVYRAKDTRLDRIVAIKILPEHISNKPQARERFEREARAVSSLNHPHICTLHDIGHQDGIDFLVMEFLDGDTLAHRLRKGPLPADEVLQFAIQIADALATAHRHGVVHRDLKPGNIMLTKSGAKLLDFGLAKVRTAEPVAGMTALPTQTTPLTGAGTILGTLQYMAPEQLEGQEADARTDIFAFGAVLYEMATGRKAFEGKSQASLISAIMTTEPPLISMSQTMAPPLLDHVVRMCMAKEPDARWQSAHDVMAALQWVGVEQVQVATPAPRRALWPAMAALAAATLVPVALYFRPAPPAPPSVRSSILLPERMPITSMALSPDGQRLAIAAGEFGNGRLWLRSLDSLVAQALPGTQGALAPFWSPDSRFIAFNASGQLKKIDVSASVPGPVQAITEATTTLQNFGGAWNRDGIILFNPRGYSGLYRVFAAGGSAVPQTMPDVSQPELRYGRPQFLPDGRHFIYFSASSQPEKRAVYLGSLDSKETTRILSAESQALHSNGYLLFLRGGTLFAQRFDVSRLQIMGDPVLVAEGVGQGGFGPATFSVADGVLAYSPSNIGLGLNQANLTWFDRTGKQLRQAGTAGIYGNFEISPDERTLAFSTRSERATAQWDVWLLRLASGAMSRFTFQPSNDLTPIWSPDGSRIVFASNRNGHFDLYQKLSVGTGTEELLLESGLDMQPDDWSRDGRFLLYEQTDTKTNKDLWVVPTFGDRKPLVFAQTRFNEHDGRFSPDGKWIAYVSDESDRTEINVQPFPPTGGKWQISTGGGQNPRWRRDGKELFYLAPGGQLMSVDVNARATFETGAPRPLFSTNEFQFAVAGDGERFLIPVPVEGQTTAPVTIVTNWMAGLKK